MFRSSDVNLSWMDEPQQEYRPPTPEEIEAGKKKQRDEATQSLLKYADHRHYQGETEPDRTVLYYLKKGADIEAKAEGSASTPLGVAVAYHNSITAKTLIDAGARFDVLNNYGHTPFSQACQYGYNELVTYFMEKGADINQRNLAGVTPLMWAATHCRTETVDILLAAGARFETAANDGKTIFDYCREGKDDGRVYGGTLNPQTGQREGGESGCTAYAKLERLLLDRWRARHVAEGCPKLDETLASKILNAAAAQGDADIAALAIAAGANVNAPDIKGTTPLIAAARRKDADMMKRLVSSGADVNLPDATGTTPLMTSMLYYSGATVKCLMDLNAHVDLKDKWGRTAFDHAWQGVRAHDTLEGRPGLEVYDELKGVFDEAAKRQSLEQYQTGLRKPVAASHALTLGKAAPKRPPPTALKLQKPPGA